MTSRCLQLLMTMPMTCYLRRHDDFGDARVGVRHSRYSTRHYSNPDAILKPRAILTLGGRWEIGDPQDVQMRIPDNVLNCVAFICSPAPKGRLDYAGTCFFVGVKSSVGDGWFTYAVTAKHVVKGAKPGDLVFRLNKHDGSVDTEPIIDSWEMPADADVAVQALKFPLNRFRHGPIEIALALTPELRKEHGIGIGDDIAAVGLFSDRAGKERNQPIVRVGTIAAMPSEPVKDDLGGVYPAYMVEMHSTSGFSGSPVFCFLDPGRVNVAASNEVRSSRTVFLLGVARGHWNLVGSGRQLRFGKREVLAINSGIGLVSPIEDAIRLIMSEDAVKARRKHEEKTDHKNTAVTDSARKKKGR
jgi:hypothetical protein